MSIVYSLPLLQTRSTSDAPWLSWPTLRRTHATLLSESGSSPKDAQAQLGHAHISTTMDIYTKPTPQHERGAVDRLSDLVTNGDELSIWGPDAALATLQIHGFSW
jgi:Phage integrase family